MLFLKIFLLSCLISSIGFKKFIYFISYGYGNSITGLGLYLLISNKGLTVEDIILGTLYILYGLRLSIFLFLRNQKQSYQRKVSDKIEVKKQPTMFVKIMIWLTVALLYACQSSPLGYRIISPKKENENKKLLYISFIISITGFIIEIIADNQKSAAKKINPNRFVDSGLYKIVRCPNYFGEIIFWTGNFISGFNVYVGFSQWFITFLGYAGIVFVMFSGARRIEINQNQFYGKDEKYKEYAKKTPILIPFLPLYSVEKYSWLTA